MAKLQLYTRRFCPYCDRAKTILASAGITDYEEVPIDGNESVMRQRLHELTGGRWDVPQVFVADAYIGDDDDLARLAQDGGLIKLVEAAV